MREAGMMTAAGVVLAIPIAVGGDAADPFPAIPDRRLGSRSSPPSPLVAVALLRLCPRRARHSRL